MPAIDISKLSIEEKWELLDELWESIYASPEAATLTKAQREELDRRIEELDRDGSPGQPLEQVLREIENGSE